MDHHRRQYSVDSSGGGSATLAQLMAPPAGAIREETNNGNNMQNTGIRYGIDSRLSAGSAQEYWSAPRARLLSASSMMSGSSVNSQMFVPTSPHGGPTYRRESYDNAGHISEMGMDSYGAGYTRGRLDSSMSSSLPLQFEYHNERGRSNSLHPDRMKDEGSDRETDFSSHVEGEGGDEDGRTRKRLHSHGSLATVYDACKALENGEDATAFGMDDSDKAGDLKAPPAQRRMSNAGMRASFDNADTNGNTSGFGDFGNGEVGIRHRTRTYSYGGFLDDNSESDAEISSSSGEEGAHHKRRRKASHSARTYRSISDAEGSQEGLHSLLAASAVTQTPEKGRPGRRQRASTRELENLAELSSSLSKLPDDSYIGNFSYTIKSEELPTLKSISGPHLRKEFNHQGVYDDKMGFKAIVSAPRPFQQRLSACGGPGMISQAVDRIIANARSDAESSTATALIDSGTSFSLTPDRGTKRKNQGSKSTAKISATTQNSSGAKRRKVNNAKATTSASAKKGRPKTARPPSGNTYTVTEDNRLVNNPPEGYLDAEQVASSLAKAAVPHKLDHIMKLKRWVYDHWSHPYPSPEEKQELLKELSGSFSSTQLKDWFRNERKRYWRPFQDSQVWEQMENSRRESPKNSGYRNTSTRAKATRSRGSDIGNYRPGGTARSVQSRQHSTRSSDSVPASKSYSHDDDAPMSTNTKATTSQNRNRDGCDDPEGVLRNGTLTFSALQEVADFSLMRVCSDMQLSLPPDERKKIQRDLYSRLIAKQRQEGVSAVEELKTVALKVREAKENRMRPNFSAGSALNEAHASLNKYIDVRKA